jgi:hypothetical protein
LARRKIRILIIRTVSHDSEDIRHPVPAAVLALKSIPPGQFIEVRNTLCFAHIPIVPAI